MGDPISTITGAATAIKAIADMVSGLRRRKGRGNETDPETAKVLAEIGPRLVALEKDFLGLAEDNRGLEEENRELRAKVRSHEEGALERQHYKSVKAGAAGDVIIVDDRNPDIPRCSTCYATHGLSVPLKPMPRDFRALGSGSHLCPHCKQTYSLDAFDMLVTR